jgi:hypothetical protein
MHFTELLPSNNRKYVETHGLMGGVMKSTG